MAIMTRGSSLNTRDLYLLHQWLLNAKNIDKDELLLEIIEQSSQTLDMIEFHRQFLGATDSWCKIFPHEGDLYHEARATEDVLRFIVNSACRLSKACVLNEYYKTRGERSLKKMDVKSTNKDELLLEIIEQSKQTLDTAKSSCKKFRPHINPYHDVRATEDVLRFIIKSACKLSKTSVLNRYWETRGERNLKKMAEIFNHESE